MNNIGVLGLIKILVSNGEHHLLEQGSTAKGVGAGGLGFLVFTR